MVRGQASSTPAFGTPSTPSFATDFRFHSSLTSPQQQSQSQLNTQLNDVQVEPVPFSIAVADHDIHAIINAYKDEPVNPMYAFKHFLFSVTEPLLRMKPAGVSDIMWAEAMGKLEDMERADRERLWPQIVQGFKDLSQRLMIQEDVIVSDAQRLRVTQSNVKMVMRIVEALAVKGCRIPLTKGETELANKLATITRQLKGPGVDLCRKVRHLLTASRVQTNSVGDFGGSVYLQQSIKIHEKSLADLQEVLQKQMEGIARLGSVVKRDIRDLEIVIAKGHKNN